MQDYRPGSVITAVIQTAESGYAKSHGVTLKLRFSYSLRTLLALTAVSAVLLFFLIPVEVCLSIEDQFIYGFINLVEEEQMYVSFGKIETPSDQIPCQFVSVHDDSKTAVVRMSRINRFRVSTTAVYDCSVENDGWCIWHFPDEVEIE